MGRRGRSRSPGAPRRTDTTKPPPEGVDRYVPGANRRERSRSPGRGRDGGRGGGRRGATRREGEEGGRRDERGGGGRERVANGRQQKTQEELVSWEFLFSVLPVRDG